MENDLWKWVTERKYQRNASMSHENLTSFSPDPYQFPRLFHYFQRQRFCPCCFRDFPHWYEPCPCLCVQILPQSMTCSLIIHVTRKLLNDRPKWSNSSNLFFQRYIITIPKKMLQWDVNCTEAGPRNDLWYIMQSCLMATTHCSWQP